MDEVSHQETSLLEQLRQKFSEERQEEARQKMKLMIKHQTEFPSKLRPVIAEAESNGATDPETFLAEFYKNLRSCIKYISFDNLDSFDDEAKMELVPRWYPDSDVDTEDEVELMFRLFPMIFRCNELLDWTKSVKTVSFVPLLAKLTFESRFYDQKIRSRILRWNNSHCSKAELDEELDEQRFYDQTELLQTLLCNDSHGSNDELDKASLAVLMLVKGEKWVSKTAAFDLMEFFLKDAMNRDIAFIETRLRFLIDWEPKVLMDNSQSRFHDCHNLRIFKVMTELGMFHYPLQLGFVFKNNGLHLLGYYVSNFELACHAYGAKQVLQIVNNNLSSVALRQYCENSRPKRKKKDFLIEVAASKIGHSPKIRHSADAIYTILRHDPIGMLYR